MGVINAAYGHPLMAHWVVWSFEHAAWWGPDHRGYVRELAQAGRYSELQALRIEHDANLAVPHELAMSLADAERRGPPRRPPSARLAPEA